jgi:tetratricopeptide (TPR) repeat protein
MRGWQFRRCDDAYPGTSFDKSPACFEKALEIDPDFAIARVWVAGHPSARMWYCLVDPRKVRDEFKENVDKALDAAPESYEAWSMMALYHGSFENDLKAACEPAFLKAIDLANRQSKGYANAHHWYGGVLSQLSRHDEALEQALIARRLDPVSPIITTWVGLRHYYARRLNEALGEMDKALDLQRDFVPAHWHRSWVCGAAAKTEQALHNARRARELSPENNVYLIYLAWAEAVAGNESEARRLMARLDEIEKTRFVPNYHRAAVHAALGEREAAVRRLERAFENDEDWRQYVATDPRLDAVRDDPRVQALIRRLNLP